MKLQKNRFPARRSRAVYIAERFRKYLHGEILDLGCEDAHLRELMPHLSLTGIDLRDKDDLHSFADHSFDCVLCSHVLEQHINSIHQIFLELLRLSRRYVIISLPNNSSCARLSMGNGKTDFINVGLVPEAVMDILKGSFNLCDIVDFMEGYAKQHSFDIVEMFSTDKPHSLLSQMLKRANNPAQKKPLSCNSNTLWTVIEKKKYFG